MSMARSTAGLLSSLLIIAIAGMTVSVYQAGRFTGALEAAAPLRAQIEAKDRELAVLRSSFDQRLEDGITEGVRQGIDQEFLERVEKAVAPQIKAERDNVQRVGRINARLRARLQKAGIDPIAEGLYQ